MRIGVGVPSGSEDPSSGLRNMVASITTEAWLNSRPDGRQVERLASAWKWNDAATVLRLTLRHNVYFHDGTLLTPQLATQALRESVNASEMLSFSSISSVDVSGDDSIDITLKAPNSFLLTDLALTSVRKPGTTDIGTGPFRAEQVGGQTVLRAFPRYYRGPPGIDRIDITTYPTQRGAWAAFMRGDLDMLHDVSREIEDLVRAETTIRTYSFPRPYYIPLGFNVRHPILKRAEVRMAINEALDRESLIRDGMRGRGRPANGPVWPDHWAYVVPAQPVASDAEGARKRLDAAGFPVRRESNGKMPSRLSFTCLVFASDPRFERLAVLVQKQLADIGIDMTPLPLPQKELVARLRTGEFDAFLFEMYGGTLSYTYEFWHSRESGLVKTGYQSADAVFDRIRGARSEDDVRVGVTELANTLHQDPPAAFIAWQTLSRAVSTKFDVAAEPNRDILSNIWQWRPAALTK